MVRHLDERARVRQLRGDSRGHADEGDVRMRDDHPPDPPPGGLGGDQKGLAGMQVTSGKRQAVPGDGIKYPPGSGKEPPVLSGGQPAHARRGVDVQVDRSAEKSGIRW